VSETH